MNPEYSFTLTDDTGSHRLSEDARMRLHIAMETEGEVQTDEVLPAGTSQTLTVVSTFPSSPPSAKAASAEAVDARARQADVLGAEEAMGEGGFGAAVVSHG